MSSNLSGTFEVLIERHDWNFFVKKNKKASKNLKIIAHSSTHTELMKITKKNVYM